VPGRPFVLAESTWESIRATSFEVAVLPWGATEAHNRHLPYATDTIQSEAIAAESTRLAWESGTRALVLPAVPFGVNTGQVEVPFCLNMNPSTQLALLRDVARSLVPHGVRKLVILNGHGGNDFRQIIRELQPAVGLLLCQVNWYSCVDARPFFAEPGDHAGELETSVMQHIAPDLVRPLSEAGPGGAKQFAVRGLREGWAWTPRHWVEVTEDTGVGNPANATAEKGSRFFAAVTQQIAAFLKELADADPAALYE
jgi:creatinine amidohydrolase